MARQVNAKLRRQVFGYVLKIPVGRVVTYGDIAGLLGINPRVVGSVMAGINDTDLDTLPWHRVVGAGGTIPALKYGFRGQVQINLLKDEGLEFSENLRIKDFQEKRFSL